MEEEENYMMQRHISRLKLADTIGQLQLALLRDDLDAKQRERTGEVIQSLEALLDEG